MSKLVSKFLGFFTSRTLAGVDKTGNRYFARKETINGAVKEKRFVVFKGEEDPTSIPVEWICWLNGQRKKAPTPQEIIELEARREQVKLKVELLKEQEKSTGGSFQQSKSTDKVGPPDLKSFIQQFPGASFGHNRGKGHEEASGATSDTTDKDGSSEPSGSGGSVGIWWFFQTWDMAAANMKGASFPS